jgi:hypothetical protein
MYFCLIDCELKIPGFFWGGVGSQMTGEANFCVHLTGQNLPKSPNPQSPIPHKIIIKTKGSLENLACYQLIFFDSLDYMLYSKKLCFTFWDTEKDTDFLFFGSLRQLRQSEILWSK